MSVKIKISKAKPYVWHSEELHKKYNRYSKAFYVFGIPATGLMFHSIITLQGELSGFLILGLVLLLPTFYCTGVYMTIRQINSHMNIVDE